MYHRFTAWGRGKTVYKSLQVLYILIAPCTLLAHENDKATEIVQREEMELVHGNKWQVHNRIHMYLCIQAYVCIIGAGMHIAIYIHTHTQRPT